MQKEDLRGRRFGKLTVLEQAQVPDKKYAVHWLCRCDCGNGTVVRADRLKSGGTRSCGCLRRYAAAKRNNWQLDITSERNDDVVGVGMKLKYILTTYDQLDSGARFVQKLTGEPFHVMYYQGTVLINREVPHLDKVLQALEQWWESEDSPEVWDRSFEIISKAAGKTTALQSSQAWREATMDRRKKETAAAAAQWIDTVFEAVDLDAWDDLCDQGYDDGLLEAITTEFFERQKAEGFQQCESWLSLGRKAAFLYGYRLGQTAQGEKPR